MTKICPKRVFSLKNRKRHHHQWTVYFRISLGNKFQLKVTILILWTKFAQKRYFWWKTEKVNITIEICLFELVWIPNFNVNWQFLFFGGKLATKGCFSGFPCWEDRGSPPPSNRKFAHYEKFPYSRLPRMSLCMSPWLFLTILKFFFTVTERSLTSSIGPSRNFVLSFYKYRCIVTTVFVTRQWYL